MGLGFESLRVYKKLRRINSGSSEFFCIYARHGVTLFFIVSLQPMNRTDLTQGSIWGNITTFLLPYILAYFLQILYGLADLFVIGRYCGVDSTTAVSNGAQVIFPEVAVGIFTDDPVVVEKGAVYLQGYIYDCLFAGIHFCFSGL